MNFIFYTIFLVFLIIILNNFFKKKNILISETGDSHQKFASKNQIPLTGGMFIFFGLIYFFNINESLFFIFMSLVLLLGVLSDLKYLESASLRFILQISIVLLFVILNELTIVDTRIIILDEILKNIYFNYIFVSFCILIVMNGSNFIDGLNTLNVGYYLLISLLMFYLKYNDEIIFSTNLVDYFLIFLGLVFILNSINKIYLGDSGSYLLGFIFSIVMIETYNLNENLSPFFIILLLWYPCFETLFSIIRKNIVKKSPMSPDTKHLHQLIYIFIMKKYKLRMFSSNLISSNIINLYNFLIFLIAVNNISNSQTQILLILLNLVVYTVIYFKIYFNKIKSFK